MNPKQLKKCLKICQKNKYETEYSYGITTLKNIKQISKTGVNFRISVGTITHSAKSFFDSSLSIL